VRGGGLEPSGATRFLRIFTGQTAKNRHQPPRSVSGGHRGDRVTPVGEEVVRARDTVVTVRIVELTAWNLETMRQKANPAGWQRRARGGSRAQDVDGSERSSLSIASSREDQAGWEHRSGGASQIGTSSGQRCCGACRREGPSAGEHVPDRVSEPAGDVNLRDLGTALLAEPPLHPLVPIAIDAMAAGVDRRFQERPPQVARAELESRPRRSWAPDW
jgi:hypothetical protein